MDHGLALPGCCRLPQALSTACLPAALLVDSKHPSPRPLQATHIFDGLESWPSHIMYVAGGRLQVFAAAADVPELQEGRLLELVERWLREEQRQRAQRQGNDPAKWHDEHAADGEDGALQLASFNNGWAAGRLTSTLQHSANTVMRM